MKKLLVSMAVAVALLFPAAPIAQAASTGGCSATVNNGDINPTWRVTCRGFGTKQYRAKAWCQIAWAYGPWVSQGSYSQARCFLVFVDVPKSRVEFRS